MSEAKVTREGIMQYAFGFAPPLILEAAVRCRVFDVLDAGAKTAAEVATQTRISPRGARGLLNALVGLGFLTRQGDRYALAPGAETLLVSTKPGFAGGMFRHTSRQIIPHWIHLTESVLTGRPAIAVNQEGQGAEFFREFVEDLFANNYEAARALADALKVAGGKGVVNVLDVAAGSGVWSIALAEKSPQVRVTVVDWPAVIPVCRKVAARHGVGDRYRYLSGDLLAVDYGGGYDVATLGHILHSEGERRSRELLRKVFAALAPGGTVAIAEMVSNDERTGPAQALIFALNMLVHTDEGDTFTFAEMNAWLREAGFVNPRQLEVQGPSPLLLATKPA
ncbi:MAG TPA: methyltransferase [Gemmataceae bacterium]|nr:methyltransferase [Gemmataceae bacterium]